MEPGRKQFSRMGRRCISIRGLSAPLQQARRPGTSQVQAQNVVSTSADAQPGHPVTSSADIPIQSSVQALQEALHESKIFTHPSQAGTTNEQEKESRIVPSYPKPVPRKGKVGDQISLKANYFSIQTPSDWTMYQYIVYFFPEVDSKLIKKQLMLKHKGYLGCYIFDGLLLITSKKYDQDEFLLSGEHEGQKYKIKISLKERMKITDCRYIQIFNILLRICLETLDLQQVGRYYYEADAKVAMHNHNLELWPGHITSIRHHEHGLLLCNEVTHKVMRLDTAYDLYSSLCKKISNKNDLEVAFSENIIGTTVLTDYNNKTYYINSVCFKSSPLSCFLLASKEISYKDYYKMKYGIQIKNEYQPMLVSLLKGRKGLQGYQIYLVPELCRMTGLTEVMRTNFQLMRELADKTRRNPSGRIEILQRFNRKLNTSSKVVDQLSSWNIKLLDSLVPCPGRVLPSEQIILQDIAIASVEVNDWTKEIRGKPMLRVARVLSWIVITPSSLRKNVEDFVKTLCHTARTMGMSFPEPVYKQLQDTQLRSYFEAINSSISENKPSILLVILQNNNAQRYGDIKKRCLGESYVPTQLLLSRTLSSKSLPTIAAKIAIQINCKLGGAPWTVKIPSKSLMVIGFDVYHEVSKETPSVGVMVASQDTEMSRYLTKVNYYNSEEELSNFLSSSVCKAAKGFEQCNGSLPKRIIVYRDGVGEGQIPMVYEKGVLQLQSQLKKLYGENVCEMAFIIVTKRINTRFFYDRSNPPPGTVVDDVVTLPDRYDFFLVSQSVRVGTASPVSYNVIHDTTQLNADQIQRLSYKLTHLYYNWNGTVRVPAPVLYAHKLAYLIGQVTHSLPSQHMEHLLYFL